MNFDYSADQRLLKDEARRFLDGCCSPAVVRGVLDDASRSYDAGLWTQLADMGWLGSVLPEAHGGLGLGHVELCAIAEEMGRVLAPVPFASTLYFFAQALMQFGTEEQQAHWLPQVASGDCIGCFAAAEGAGEPIPARLQASVEGGRLRGDKIPVIDGDVAHVAIVLAQGEQGPGLFLVDLREPGVKRAPLASLDPTRGLAGLSFADVAAEQLGRPGEGLRIATQVYRRAAALLAFEQIGGADRCLEMAKTFALERYAFGRPIASYQAIKHKLAEVYVRNELARSNAYYAAWALDKDVDGHEMPIAAAAARIAASDAYWHAAKENIQTHGGMGFTWEVDAHLYYRRAQQLALAAGAPRWWKEHLATELESRHVGAPEEV
ncbi:MAG: acyl-CoA dehydrogenase family protein [Pseudomonas sp.]|uniref:acyl-CoA dehydrogenase family protein n=1 Tax=Pseudomonas sp. TaxID=306 RepID=UPI003982CC31